MKICSEEESNKKYYLSKISSLRYNLVCAPIKYSDQPAHLHSVIRVFDGCSMGSKGPQVHSGESRDFRGLRIMADKIMAVKALQFR